MAEPDTFKTIKNSAYAIGKPPCKQPDQTRGREAFDQWFYSKDDYPSHQNIGNS